MSIVPLDTARASTPQAKAAAAAAARAPEAGQGIVEFGAILALAAVVAVVVLVLFRPQLAFVLSLIGSEVEKSGLLFGTLASLA